MTIAKDGLTHEFKERRPGTLRYRGVVVGGVAPGFSGSTGMSQTKLKPMTIQPGTSCANVKLPRTCATVQPARPNRPTVLGPVETVVEKGTMKAGS